MDDWSDLADTWDDIAEKETKRVKQRVSQVFAEAITKPLPTGRVNSDGIAPVNTGNWLANTIASVGTPDKSVNSNEDEDGFPTLSKILFKINESPTYSKVFIQNNSSYNNEVEYTGWRLTPAYRPWRRSLSILEEELDKI